MKVSKNQVVCALCHFAGLQSGIDCNIWSSAENGWVSCSVMLRTSRYCSRKGLQLNCSARLACMAICFLRAGQIQSCSELNTPAWMRRGGLLLHFLSRKCLPVSGPGDPDGWPFAGTVGLAWHPAHVWLAAYTLCQRQVSVGESRGKDLVCKDFSHRLRGPRLFDSRQCPASPRRQRVLRLLPFKR